VVKYDGCQVPVKLAGKTFLDWSDRKVRPHFWDRLYDAIGKPGDFTADPDVEGKPDMTTKGLKQEPRDRLTSEDPSVTGEDDRLIPY